MSDNGHLDIVDRLRGHYHLPVNDGAGPLNGGMTFSREFPTSPIQREAAELIERFREIVAASLPAMTHHWSMYRGGPKKSAALALLERAKAIIAKPYDRPNDDRMGERPGNPSPESNHPLGESIPSRIQEIIFTDPIRKGEIT